MEWMEIVEKLLLLIVTFVIGLLGEFLRRKGIREKFDNIKISEELKTQIAYTAVLFAQQWYNDKGGEIKFNKASEFLSGRLRDIGISLSENEIRGLLESALKTAKKEFQDNW